jgi:hypothetical protein
MSVSQKTINDLPALERDVADSDLIAIDDGTTTYKVAVEDFESTSAASARTYAEAAAASADEAKGYKNTAQAAVADVDTKVTAAQGYANAASGSATNAYNYADAAAGSATTSAQSATAASSSASTAQGYAQTAGEKAGDASDEADRARSWADYPNQSTHGSATNNAHYWADQARAAAGGGVMSFNTRNGYVVSQDGDYNAGQVVYNPATSGLSATRVQGAIDEVKSAVDDAEGDITDLQNYKEDKPAILTQTLSAGATSLTFTSAKLTSTAIVDIYTDKYGVAPKEADDIARFSSLILCFTERILSLSLLRKSS